MALYFVCPIKNNPNQVCLRMSNFQFLKSTRTARQKSSVQNNAGRLVHEVTVGPDKNASKNSDGQAVAQISPSGENKCVEGEKDDKALEGEIRKSGSMSTIALMAPTTAAETIPVEPSLGNKSRLMKLYEKELDGVGIEIKDIPGRGRGLVSAKSFKAGEFVYPHYKFTLLAHCVTPAGERYNS